jgi:two-component system sensor histidine kinase EvgS
MKISLLAFFLFGVTALPAQIKWTPEERTWIENNPSLVFALDDQTPPMSYRGDDGEMRGLTIDYAELLAQRIGVTFLYEGTDWTSAIAKALQHTVDGILNATITDFREEYLNFTQGYFSIPNAILTSRQSPQIRGPLDLAGLRTGVLSGTERVQVLREWAPRAQIVELDSLATGADLLLRGELDAIIDESSVIQSLLENLFDPELKLNTLVSFPTLDSVHIGLRNNDPMMHRVLNKAIATLDAEDHERLRSKYFPDYNPLNTLRVIELSGEELLWIQQNPVLRVGVDPNFTPFEFLDRQGEYQGLNIEYLRKVTAILGLQLQLESDRPWTEYLDLLQRGEIDLISGISSTPAREKNLLFTEPFFEMPIVIFAKDTSPYVGNLSEVRAGKVGVIRGFAIAEVLRQDYPQMDLHYVQGMDEGFDALEEGDLDLFVANLITGGYYLRDSNTINIKVVGKTEYNMGLTFGVNKDQQILLSLLNKGLGALTLGDRERIYNNWIGLEYEARTDYGLLILIISGSSLIILGFFLWNRSMRGEIHRRKRTESLLTQTNAELESTLTRLEETQTQLIQSEKMSSMGVLVSGIAHELNNPLNYIASGVGAMEEVINQLTFPDAQGPTEEDWETLKALCHNIQIGVERSRDIVAGLKDYSRLDSGIVTQVNMNHCIDLALTMISYEVDSSIIIKKEITATCPLSRPVGKTQPGDGQPLEE